MSEKKHLNFYLKFRAKILSWLSKPDGSQHPWAKYLIWAPDLFYLLTRLVLDPEVSAKYKAQLGFVIVYFISPIDLMPEALFGTIGYFDDMALAVYALNLFLNQNSEDVIRRHWVGEGDVLKFIRHFSQVLDEMLGSGLARRLKTLFDKFTQNQGTTDVKTPQQAAFEKLQERKPKGPMIDVD